MYRVKDLSMEQWLDAFDTNPSDFHLGFDFEINDLAGFAYIEVAYLNINNHEFALPYHEDFDLAEHIPFLEFLVKEFDDEVNNFNRKRMFAEASAISDKGEFYKDQLNKLKRSKTASAREKSMEQWLESFNATPHDFWVNFDFDRGDNIEYAYLNIKNFEFKLPQPSEFDRAELLPFLLFVIEEIEDAYVNKRTDYPSESLDQADAIRDLMDSYEDQINILKRSKTASSQASWSILAGGVSDARVEAYKLRIAIDQMVNALKESPAIEEVYRLCGDTFLTIPDVLSKIERHLDKTNYALIQMGSDFYRQRLPHSDRETVDIASKYNPTPSAARYINSEETTKQAASSGVFWSGIADLVSDKLVGGEKEVMLTRKDLTPTQFRTLLEYEDYGLVKNFGSYLVLTEEAIQDLLDIAD